jgi:hypothetical protein
VDEVAVEEGFDSCSTGCPSQSGETVGAINDVGHDGLDAIPSPSIDYFGSASTWKPSGDHCISSMVYSTERSL